MKQLILVLINEAGTPTAWMSAPTMERLIAQLQARWSTPLLPALQAALLECPPQPSRTGRIALGAIGERQAFLLADRGD